MRGLARKVAVLAVGVAMGGVARGTLLVAFLVGVAAELGGTSAQLGTNRC